MRSVLFAVVCAGVAVAAAEAGDDDAKKLQGTWVVESTSRDKELAMPMKGGQFVFARDKVTLKMPYSKELTYAFSVDAAKKPKAMDFAPTTNVARRLMIYELDGDALKLCMSDKRPTEFSDKQGIVVVLKRKK
jgi:uncharacterized protein (TIGR03067 family)